MTQKEETYKGKKLIDLTPEQEKGEVKVEEPVKAVDTPTMYFTVTAASKKGPTHMLVRASSALEALQYIQNVKKYFVLAVHVTEYAHYFDSLAETDSTEEIKEVEAEPSSTTKTSDTEEEKEK